MTTSKSHNIDPKDWKKRGEQKRKIIFDWLCTFHYSNVHIMMQLLGLKQGTNNKYFKRLVDDELLIKLDLPTLRKPVYLLHKNALSLLGSDPRVVNYSVDYRRISASLARHHIATQQAIVNRKHEYRKITPERFMKVKGVKVPDALLKSDEKILALETELSYKQTKRIYMAFADHARSFRDKKYSNIEYVFEDETMRDYYQKLFNEPHWPVYRYNKTKRKYELDDNKFSPSSLDGFVDAMKFTTEKLIYE